MFTTKNDEGYYPAVSGIKLKTLVHGQKTLMAGFHLAKDSLLPPHSHPHEQTGYLVSGRMRMTIDGEQLDATAGASWCIPAEALHGAEILEDAVAIEIFSPVRPDYLPTKSRQT